MEEMNFNQGLPHELYPESDYPKVSIIIPTYNCSQIIGNTLDSLLSQVYPSFEIIIIDAGSKDRTIEVVKHYRNKMIRIFAVTTYNRYEMLNKGISLAQGNYINIIFPGDYYISKENLHTMMGFAISAHFPDLVFCGCMIRDGRSEAKLLFRNLTLDLLKQGQQPTNLQSCWFKSSLFRKIGKFDTSLQLRGGFDLLCRFMLQKDDEFRHSSIKKILLDYDLQGVTRHMIVLHFFETFKVLRRYFGLKNAIAWLLFRQKDTRRYLKSLGRSLKVAFLGR